MNTCLVKRLVIALVVLACCDVARATFATLSQRLPESSNVIVAVNLQKLIDSPYGKKQEWGERRAEAWAKQPLMIPPGATRLIMAADVKPSSMESNWEMSLVEMTKLPALQDLARAEGGHIDRVWDKDAVVSPVNAYFVPLEGNVLASITPAERTQIARWVRQPVKPEGNVTSPYIRGVLSGLSDQTDVVMAMDLDGAYGVPSLRKWLGESGVAEVSKTIEPVAQVMGSMNGITLEMRVTDKIIGTARVQFGRDAAPLKDCAKPVMLHALEYFGMRLDGAPRWTFAVSGKQVTMQGELSDADFRHLLSIVESPVPAAVASAAPGAAGKPSAAAETPADPGVASQRYFKSVSGILDGLQPGNSASESATWMRNASKRIDQMPVLNVDPALIEWSGLVSVKLKQAASVMGVAQVKMNSRVSGVTDPTYYSDYYNDNADAENRAARENAGKARRQVALEEKAKGQEQALQILNDIAVTRPKIRADMAAKYKLDF